MSTRTYFIPITSDGEVNYWGCAVRFRNGEASLVEDVDPENCLHPPLLPDGKTPHPQAGKPLEPGKKHKPGRLVEALTDVTDEDGKVTKRRDGWWLTVGEEV